MFTPSDNFEKKMEHFRIAFLLMFFVSSVCACSIVLKFGIDKISFLIDTKVPNSKWYILGGIIYMLLAIVAIAFLTRRVAEAIMKSCVTLQKIKIEEAGIKKKLAETV
ncbi:hypothetical protein B9Z55_011347 [Caenorhabditis nigoni]|uniref:Uncharacterized protein n=1 Tax=Caenorhabditis nigoni TaxID=1611254 RepID=A0A2G5UJP1_9PELO|nr:hypothetical protein B9Z55_011347 [Caenorhabditis nigoni]